MYSKFKATDQPYWSVPKCNTRVLLNWDLFLAKLTMLLKDEQFGPNHRSQLGRSNMLQLRPSRSRWPVNRNGKHNISWERRGLQEESRKWLLFPFIGSNCQPENKQINNSLWNWQLCCLLSCKVSTLYHKIKFIVLSI